MADNKQPDERFRSDSEPITVVPLPDQGPAAFPRIPNYEVIEQIGRGGMGIVYKARHLPLNRIVALKMVALRSPELLARFHAEAEAIAALQHPNIVQIYEVGEHEGQPYLSLQYIHGGTLSQSIDGSPQPPRESAKIVEALAQAMNAAHHKGVIHRDLKPQNVLLTEQGTPKITDFGLAKQLDAADEYTEAGDILGTPSYMAPEQAEGRVKDIGPRTDVYALGAILYELLTGRAPFNGSNKLEIMTLVRNQDPVAPRSLRPELPSDLETICLKCLSKEPGERYASAEALANDLAAFLAGKPIRSRPRRKPRRLWPLLASGAALIVILCATIGIGASAWLMRQAELRYLDEKQETENAKQLLDEQKRLTQQALESEKAAKKREREAIELEANARTELANQARNPVNKLASEAFQRIGQLSTQNLFDAESKAYRQTFAARLAAGQTYVVDLTSTDFDPLLRVEDPAGPILVEHTAGRGSFKAPIVFVPTKTADYHVVVTSFEHRTTGGFVLSISPSPVVTVLNAGARQVNAGSFLDKGSPAFWVHLAGMLGSPENPGLAGAACLPASDHFAEVEQTTTFANGQKYLNEGFAFARQGRIIDAEKSYRLAIALLEPLAIDHPRVHSYRHRLAGARTGLALQLAGMKSPSNEAEVLFWKSLATWNELVKLRPNDTDIRNETGVVLSHLGTILENKGNLEGARAFRQQAINHHQETLKIAPTNPLFVNNLRLCRHSLAGTLLRLAETEAAWRASSEILQNHPADAPACVRLFGRILALAEKQNNAVLARKSAAQALRTLDQLLANGYQDYFALGLDPDLDILKKRPHLAKIFRDRAGIDWEKTRITRAALTTAAPYDAKRTASFCAIVPHKLEAGKRYRIDLVSKDFDPFLRVEDSKGMQVAEDDDSAGNLNARLFFTPLVNDTYRIIVTSFKNRETGAYILGVQEMPALPNLAKAEEIRKFVGHAGLVHNVAVSADGKTAVSVGSDRTGIVWEVETGKLRQRLIGSPDQLYAVAISPDGQFAMTGGQDYASPKNQTDLRVRAWDTQSGKQIQALAGHTATISRLAAMKKSRLFVSSCWDHTIRLWNPGVGGESKLLFRLEHPISALAVAPAGERIAIGNPLGAIAVLRAGETKAIWVPAVDFAVENLAWVSDSTIAVAGVGKVPALVDITTKTRLRLVGHANNAFAIDAVPGGKFIVTGSDDGTVRVWNGSNGSEISRFNAGCGLIRALRVLPDGQRVLCTGGDGTLRLWRLPLPTTEP